MGQLEAREREVGTSRWRLWISSLGLSAVLALVGVAPAAADPPSSSVASYGTDGTVQALTRVGDTVYMGGSFSQVGLATGGGATFDAIDGRAVPATVPVSGNSVNVVTAVADGSGGFYIGGSFTEVGGLVRHNIAHILPGGSVDPNFDPNANGQVDALAISGDGSTVYVGGGFNGPDSIGGADRNHIAALDATNGQATAWDPDASDTVFALAVSGSAIYAGGGFSGTDSIGGADRNHIAALDPTTGQATNWDPNADNLVFTLAVSGDGSTVYAGGDFNGATSIGGGNRNYIAALDSNTGNATAWNPHASATVMSLAISGSTVYAGGFFSGINSIGSANRDHIAALDATTGLATNWNPDANANVYTVAVSGSTVYAGGQFAGPNSIGGADRNHIAALDASSGDATAFDPNTSDYVRTIAVSGSKVYAGGVFSVANDVPRNNLAAIDAGTGQPTSWNPNTNGPVFALAASGSTMYVGGSFSGTDSIGGANRNRIAALDLTTGQATAWNPNANGAVDALAVSGSTVYAGGNFTGAGSIGGDNRNYIAGLSTTTGDATSWNPNANSVVLAIAVSGSTVYAGGDFSGPNSIGGAARNYIAALDATTGAATTWDPSANNGVTALAVDGSTVYAGGAFSGVDSIGGENRNRIAALDAATAQATAWDPNANNTVFSLAISGSTIYAGGSFSGTGSIGGADRNNLAGIDTTTGNATSFDPNLNSAVFALAVSGSAVYAGGQYNGNGPGMQHFAAFVQGPANTALPAITGAPIRGHTLTCAKGTWSGATPQTYAYKWLRNGAAIGGATAATYLVKAADAGKQLRCRVTATNLGGSAMATSAAVAVKTPPKNTVAPKITGTPRVGKTLTCNKGTWTGSAPISYTYQWLRNGAAIAGAKSATYVAKAADQNKMFSCKVTAKNVAGQATKTSTAVKVT